MSRPTRVYIDVSAFKHNLRVLRTIAPYSKIMADLKANAYGHGLALALSGLDGADAFAVSSIEEAVYLRGIGCDKPVLAVNGFSDLNDLNHAISVNAQVIVHSDYQIQILEDMHSDGSVVVWLKLHTRSYDCGFPPDAIKDVLNRLSQLSVVAKANIIADLTETGLEDDTEISMKIEAITLFKEELSAEVSIVNSLGILKYPAAHLDWIRPGISLYGVSSIADTRGVEYGLRPVMQFVTKLIATKSVKQGEEIGYAGAYKADRDLTIGIAAAGYGDGYPRHAPSGTPVVVNGKRSVIVGRVSMDMLAVDISDIQGAEVGSSVELWGADLPIEVVASAANTIPSELLCKINKRVDVRVRNPSLHSER